MSRTHSGDIAFAVNLIRKERSQAESCLRRERHNRLTVQYKLDSLAYLVTGKCRRHGLGVVMDKKSQPAVLDPCGAACAVLQFCRTKHTPKYLEGVANPVVATP